MAAWQTNWSRQYSGRGQSSGHHMPQVPFFFRIFNPDGQGIMYKATHQTNADTYSCPGSRQIGQTHDGYKIWYIGGYSDDMPTSSMYQIIPNSITPLASATKTKFIRDNGLDASHKHLSLYFDGVSYWFTEPTSPQRKSRSKSPQRKTRSKSKGKGNRSSSPKNKTSRRSGY
jgi:hypothetical protein